MTPEEIKALRELLAKACVRLPLCNKCGGIADSDYHVFACRDALVTQLAEAKRQRDMAGDGAKVLAVSLDEALTRAKQLREALELAAFLTSDEPEEDYGSGPECRYCDSKTATPDGKHFIHRPACEWWVFRQRLAAIAQAAPDAKEEP